MKQSLFAQESLELSIQDRVATLEIRRPQALNALNQEVLSGLLHCAQLIAERTAHGNDFTEIAALVLRGAGEKAFVAGADVRQMRDSSPAELAAFIALGQQAMRAIELLPVPVIALVQGFALGGGLELALAADLIVASEQAKVGQPEVNLGLIPGFGGTQRLSARVGSGTAKRLIYTGETIGGAEAKALGLVDYLFPPDGLEAGLDQLTAQLLGRSPLALAAAKRAIEEFSGAQKRSGLTIEVEEFLRLFSSADAAEGLGAFVEKRRPEFPGKTFTKDE